MDTNTSMSTTVRKDMDKVSFVGMHNTREGIIAFADSKASREYKGEFIEDTERGRIQKVFKNDKFIFVYHGNNELFKERMKIEDYIISNLGSFNYFDFFNSLLIRLKMSPPYYNDGIYNFIIGCKDANGLYFIRKVIVDINKNQVQYGDIVYEHRVIYGGDERYRALYDSLPKYNDAPIIDYAKRIQKQIESMVDIFEQDYRYNSVGNPIKIDTFQ